MKFQISDTIFHIFTLTHTYLLIIDEDPGIAASPWGILTGKHNVSNLEVL
jgi:hypothetical protein